MKKKAADKLVDTKTATKKTVQKPRKACAKKVAAKKATVKKATVAKKSVIFTLHEEKGHKICLAGEFNDWNETAKKMTYNAKNGIYSATVKLAPGTYQYKFLIDGKWCADPQNANSVANDKGTFNSVITVS